MKFGQMKANTPKAAITPSAKDLYWAAGFLEGEGSFIAGASEHVYASQVQREPLERLQRMFGGHIRQRTPNSTAFRQQPIFAWQISGTRARGVMLTLFTLLSPKRQEQIKKAITRNLPKKVSND